MNPTPCLMDAYHGDSFPYPTYAADSIGFTKMVEGGWPFFISKGSQGSSNQDTKAVGRLASAATVKNMNIGMYHFMDNSPIHTQIANFANIYMQVMAAVPKGTFIRFAVDNEPSTIGLQVTPNSDMLAMQMGQFMYGLTGKHPLMYGDAAEFYGTSKCNWLGMCPRWLAKYGPWAKPNEWGAYWSAGQWQQFSDGTINTNPSARSFRSGRSVSGISVPGFPNTMLDMSAFSGSLADAIKTWVM